MALTQSGGCGQIGEPDGFVETCVDEAAGLGNRCGFTAIEDDDEIILPTG